MGVLLDPRNAGGLGMSSHKAVGMLPVSKWWVPMHTQFIGADLRHPSAAAGLWVLSQTSSAAPEMVTRTFGSISRVVFA